MKIAVIEYNLTAYVCDVFSKHKVDGFKIDAFIKWKTDTNNKSDIPFIDIKDLKQDSFDIYIICNPLFFILYVIDYFSINEL